MLKRRRRRRPHQMTAALNITHNSNSLINHGTSYSFIHSIHLPRSVQISLYIYMYVELYTSQIKSNQTNHPPSVFSYLYAHTTLRNKILPSVTMKKTPNKKYDKLLFKTEYKTRKFDRQRNPLHGLIDVRRSHI